MSTTSDHEARAPTVQHETIRRLSDMRDGLRHAAACPAPSHMECPTFRRYPQDAASGALGPRTRAIPAIP
jgi:hypothetical protein